MSREKSRRAKKTRAKAAFLNHLHFPVRHRQYIRTTNLVERTFVEERRRTKTILHLWTEKSLTKLVSATLIRGSDGLAKRQFDEVEQNMLHPVFSPTQDSSRKSSIRPNSRKLLVTSVTFKANACPAICISQAPIG